MVKKLFILSVSFVVLTGVAFSSISQNFPDEISPISPKPKGEVLSMTTLKPEDPYIFASLPAFDQNIKTSLKIADARPEILRQYLAGFNSPLEPLSKLIVDLSDQYNFDYRWMVAIAQQESSLCKYIPENSYNCWGWGIYGDKVTRFDSYEDALRRIAPQFTKIFLQGKHYKDPMEVMKTYTPPSDGSWAKGVSHFFDKLD